MDRTDTGIMFFTGFGLTRYREVQFSQILEFQVTGNGLTKASFGPGSLQDTFIILPRYLTEILLEGKNFKKQFGNRELQTWNLKT